ncbi:MAG: phosphate ABC transporter permease subunit PstC [Actinobacteria bacterium]|nr:phosphate ABC transporter permease subunit PstC [Actinomycetota bacterium]
MSAKDSKTEVRRKLVAGPLSKGDQVFFGTTTVAAYFAFVLVALVLGISDQGINFVLGNNWNADVEPAVFQLGPMLWGSLLIAFFGILIATPMAISMAYLIVFMLPKRLATWATTLVDLLAALPSVVIGLWGLIVFTPVAAGWADILNKNVGWIPFFSVEDPENGFMRSPFIAGWIVAVMIVPIITSVTREIFSQLSAGGVVGGILLGLGRAVGETVAIFYVLNLDILHINWANLLEPRGGAVASWILAKFGEAGPFEKQGLMAAGLVLFILTLIVNFIANFIVNKSQPWRKN